MKAVQGGFRLSYRIRKKTWRPEQKFDLYENFTKADQIQWTLSPTLFQNKHSYKGCEVRVLLLFCIFFPSVFFKFFCWRLLTDVDLQIITYKYKIKVIFVDESYDRYL